MLNKRRAETWIMPSLLLHTTHDSMRKSFADVIDHGPTLTFLMRGKTRSDCSVCVEVLQLDRKIERSADRQHEWRRAKANKRQQWSQREGDTHVLFRIVRIIPSRVQWSWMGCWWRGFKVNIYFRRTTSMMPLIWRLMMPFKTRYRVLTNEVIRFEYCSGWLHVQCWKQLQKGA